MFRVFRVQGVGSWCKGRVTPKKDFRALGFRVTTKKDFRALGFRVTQVIGFRVRFGFRATQIIGLGQV